jgi:hypothetical protein
MDDPGKPPVRREDEILRDLHAEREGFVAALEELGDTLHSATEGARIRARKASGMARRAAPAVAAVAALSLAAMLARRRTRGGRR